MRAFKVSWVAEKTGKVPYTIHAYLSGRRTPDKSTAIAWALAVNLPPLALWDEESSKKPRDVKKSA